MDGLKLGTYVNQNFTSACQKSAVEAKLDLDHIDTTSDWQAMELEHPGLLGGGRGLCRKSVTVNFKYKNLPLVISM